VKSQKLGEEIHLPRKILSSEEKRGGGKEVGLFNSGEKEKPMLYF